MATCHEDTSLASWRGSGAILMADDEETIRAIGARMLERLGFTVLAVNDGQQAVDLYRARAVEIDLVVLDLTMPHMDGAEAFTQLRRLNPDVKVLLASGYSEEDVAGRFAGRSLVGVLQKPYTLRRLREVLRGWPWEEEAEPPRDPRATEIEPMRRTGRSVGAGEPDGLEERS